jgi:hypothetical protein
MNNWYIIYTFLKKDRKEGRTMTFKVKYITGFNDQGIYFNESDLTMLLFLYEHKLLTQKQLFEIYRMNPHNQSYSYNSFCNRLNKFEKVGVIKRTRYDLIRRNGIYMYLVEVDQKGIEILYLSGYLEQNYSQRIPKSNYEHFLGIKQSVIEAYKILANEYGFAIGVTSSRDNKGKTNNYIYVFDKEKSYEITGISSSPKKEVLSIYKSDEFGINPEYPRQRTEKSFISYKGAVLTSYGHITHYFKDRGLPEDFVKGLYPDWMLVKHKKTFDIEFDKGTEKFEIIQKKMNNYIELNRKDKNKHIVFFISLDDSITMRNVTEVQVSRLSSLKHILMINGLRNKDLDVYILPLGRVHEIYKKVMIDDEKREGGKYTVEQQAQLDFIKQNHKTLRFELLNTPELQRENNIYRTKFDDYSLSILLKCNKFNEPMILLPFYLQEGNIRTMDKFCYFGGKIHNGELPAGYTKAVGIYQTKDEMIHDILSSEGERYADSLLFYCLDEQKFYDVLSKEETELTNPVL